MEQPRSTCECLAGGAPEPDRHHAMVLAFVIV
jgi:hypothetical protein